MLPGIRMGAALLVAAGALTAHPLSAQEPNGTELTGLEAEVGVLDHLRVRFSGADRFTSTADFGAFETSSHQPGGRLRIDVPVASDALLRLVANGHALLYDVDGSTSAFLPGDRFGDFYAWNITLRGAYLVDESITLFSEDERWGMLIQGGAAAAWEDGSDMDDGVRGMGSFAVGYRLGERLELIAGVSVRSRLAGGGVSIRPLVEFDWQINQAWRLRSLGLGLQLERILNDDLTVFARVRLEGSSYRLADRGGEVGKGIFRSRQLPAGLGIRWRISPSWRVRLMAGAVAYHQLRIKDDDRDTVESETASSPQAFVSLRVDFRP